MSCMKSMTHEKNNNCDFTPGMKEWCFYHDGMTLEEFEAKYEYLGEHLDDLRNGTYRPLWKQRMSD